jgi:AhpD family alkylhydroperoxidase
MAHSKMLWVAICNFGSRDLIKQQTKEVVNYVSQVNGCKYCQSAHTATGKMNGFTDDQIIELRKGVASWDSKTNVLAQTAQRIAAVTAK